MSQYTNYDDVVAQLESVGLIIDGPLKLATGKKSVRCKVSGSDKEKRGWYRLYEWRTRSGEVFITGSYGVWYGDESNTNKIELTKECENCHAQIGLKEKTCPSCGKSAFKKREFTDEEKAAFRARIADDKKRAEEERNAEIAAKAKWATAVWRACREAQPGEHDYLVRKGLEGTGGARIFESNDGIMLDGDAAEAKDAYKYLATFHGALVVPLCDELGVVYGLQFILSRQIHGERIRATGRDKEYWPAGMGVEGHYWLIGGTPRGLMLEAEGFATGLRLHNATSLPVAIAFAANNLGPVAKNLAKRFRKRVRNLICADDDWLQKCKACGKYTAVSGDNCTHCGQPHGKLNAGITRAQEAAIAVEGCAWVAPKFSIERPSDRKGPTDFDDLAAAEGVQVVTAQIEAKLAELGWRERSAPALASQSAPRAGLSTQGGGEAALKPLITIDEAAGRFALIYGMGGKSVFDFQEFRVVHKDEMLNITPGRAWDDIKRHPDWKVYRDSEVGFDPDGSNPEIKCNLYSGWPTTPKKGRCNAILELLEHLCSHETTHAHQLFEWIVKWLAYPIQHPGAKMQTALIVHGDQGAGKNTFFSKALRPIYGKYGVEFGQTAMEEKFNGWMSGILFGIGNEVIASREELYHVKGKIKNMITEPYWQIRSMHQDARMERNCCNFTFFSNDLNALHLDPKDRRFCVVWTPSTPQPGDSALEDFKKLLADVHEELANGGSAALHAYLLSLDIGDFGVATPPPLTQAKEDLIELNLDSKERFFQEWINGNLGNIPCGPVTTVLLYELYREWCSRTGIRNAAPQHTLLATIYKKPNVKHEQTQVFMPDIAKSIRGTVVYASGVTDTTSGKSKTVWLGEEVEAFKNALNGWKEGKSC